MMNDVQVDIQEQGFRSLASFDSESANYKGYSSQQPFIPSQNLRTAVPSDITSSHFESGSKCFLDFPQFDQQDHNIPPWSQASEPGNSRDTLQSLVQSSLCSNQNTRSYQDNFRCQIRNAPQEKHIEFQQNQQYNNISFQFQLEESMDYSHHGFMISPTSSNNNSEREAKRRRIRWTQELHNQFLECVNRLGGAKKATPKGILKLMNCEGLTIFHIKSHLQKYRVAQYIPESKEDNTEKAGTNSSSELDIEMGVQIVEALKMQIDVQRRLYEQLECQRNLQSRIEEQAQQLKKMFDRQRETNTMPTP